MEDGSHADSENCGDVGKRARYSGRQIYLRGVCCWLYSHVLKAPVAQLDAKIPTALVLDVKARALWGQRRAINSQG